MNHGGSIRFQIRNESALGARPIVYVHGAMSNRNVWLLFSREVAQSVPDRAGYMLDLPGHGQAPGPGCSVIAHYASAVIRFFDDQGIEAAILVGHSMGGAIAQQIALDHPDRVERLVLLATGARLGVTPQILQAFRTDFDATVDQIGAIAFGQAAPREIVEPAVEQMRAVGPDVAVGDFSACNAFDAVGKLEQVRCPALVCSGDSDLLTPPKSNQLLAQSLDCPYHQLADTGHMIQMERPRQLADIVVGFIGQSGDTPH